MNKKGMTASDLVSMLRDFEYDTDRDIEVKDGAFTYDMDGFAETILPHDDKFDFNWDNSEITAEGFPVFKFRFVARERF